MNEHAYAFQISAPGTRDVAVVKSNQEGLPARFQRAGLRGTAEGSLDRYGGLPEANQRDADREGQMRRNTGNATNQRDADRDADLMERRLQNHNTKTRSITCQN